MVSRVSKNNNIRIVAIILAAGQGKRIGYIPKWKLLIDGKNILTLIKDKLLYAGISDICCILNKYSISDIISHENISYIINDNFEIGMISSVYTGINKGISGDYYMFFPVDHPFIDSKTILMLCRCIENTSGILKPTYNGQSGHPIIVSNKVANKIPISYYGGLKSFFDDHNFNTDTVETNDPGILININTIGDLKKYKIDC